MIAIAKFNMFVNNDGFLQVDIDIPGRNRIELSINTKPSPEARLDLLWMCNKIIKDIENE